MDTSTNTINQNPTNNAAAATAASMDDDTTTAAAANPDSPSTTDALDLSGTGRHQTIEDIRAVQPTINLGMIGHVAHGKTTLTRALTGIDPIRFDDERRNNCTIRLGHANVKIYACTVCPRPLCYETAPSDTPDDEMFCQREDVCGGAPMDLVKHISFVDCPGHDKLMATMLNGAAVMDAALLLTAANEACPKPQTVEHLAAAEVVGVDRLVVVQNKIDMCDRATCEAHHDALRAFLDGTVGEDAPVIPLSAQFGYNLDVLLDALVALPEPDRDEAAPARMVVIRSFDVNKPGTKWDRLVGGIAGGSVTQGVFEVSQKVEIRPGLVSKAADGSLVATPLTTTVTSLQSEKNRLGAAHPGGLIGMGTGLDPALTRGDALVGQVIGAAGTLPPVYKSLVVSVRLLHRVVGDAAERRVDRPRKGESLLLSVGALSVTATVAAAHKSKAKLALSLDRPVCAAAGDTIPISRRTDNSWRLIGIATLVEGETLVD